MNKFVIFLLVVVDDFEVEEWGLVLVLNIFFGKLNFVSLLGNGKFFRLFCK